MKRFAKSVLSAALAVAVVSTASSVSIGVFAEDDSSAYGDVIYEENFDNIADGELPEGWTLSSTLSDAGGTATVQNGKLVVQATGADLGKVMLPSSLNETTNFMYEVDAIFDATRDATRYVTVCYRQQEVNEQYYHMCYRFTPSNANGVEAAARNPGTWSVLSTGSADEYLEYGDVSHLKVIAYEEMVYEYVNDELIVTADFSALGEDLWLSGGFAIGCNYSTCEFDNIKITALKSNPVEPDRVKEEHTVSYPAKTYILMNDGSAQDIVDSESGKGITGSVNEDGNLVLTIEGGSSDPQYPIDFANVGKDEEVSIEDYPVMAIRARFVTDPVATGAQCYFYTSSNPGASASYVLTYNYKTDNEWHTYYLNGTGSSNVMTLAENGDCWNGMRFDVMASSASTDTSIEIAWIAFFENAESAAAFDGDFSAIPTPTPTAEPTATPAPTATPEPTDTPAPTEEATEEPAATETTSTGTKSGCGSVIAGSSALVVLLAAAFVLRKRH